MEEQFLTIDEVAERLRVSRWSVTRYIKSGALKATKTGHGRNGAVRIPLSSFITWINDHTVTAEERTR
ncbi:helix-turn-helix domain-containing protein [Micromonospora tarensis]|uniref:Helix-turn-helix domain-containing protein n=1 Tax=Micromonospora tarensis TaxID=2806100 RepID=A0ABS1Y9N1_9ACTN|nr:helix-turn-helix domain-containing protein [Micromonospora tarensis]MBM0274103.1 helix-turn-helix domain-containing protein [Micromonospora tarensis]